MYDSFSPRAFLSPQYQVKFAVTPWERDGAARLRRDVFCVEQGVFEGDDRDDTDARAIPLVAVSKLAFADEAVVGTVRIHEDAPGGWWGSRLAVAASHRRVGALGAALIRLAVGSAHARGCHTFYARVQAQNALLFQRLHWTTLEEIDVFGRPHHFMQADLDHYPPLHDPETGFTALGRRAA